MPTDFTRRSVPMIQAGVSPRGWIEDIVEGIDDARCFPCRRAGLQACLAQGEACASADLDQPLDTEDRGSCRAWLLDLAPTHLATYQLPGADLLLRAVGCAAAMEALCAEESTEIRSTAYLAGLFHCLGLIFIDRAVAGREDEPVVLGSPPPRSLAAVEQKLFGINHATVAALALRSWGFPEQVVAPIERQFLVLADPSTREITQRLSLARDLSRLLLYPASQWPVGRWGQLVYGGQRLESVLERARLECQELLS